MKVFLDTNIVVDFYDCRGDFFIIQQRLFLTLLAKEIWKCMCLH